MKYLLDMTSPETFIFSQFYICSFAWYALIVLCALFLRVFGLALSPQRHNSDSKYGLLFPQLFVKHVRTFCFPDLPFLFWACRQCSRLAYSYLVLTVFAATAAAAAAVAVFVHVMLVGVAPYVAGVASDEFLLRTAPSSSGAPCARGRRCRSCLPSARRVRLCGCPLLLPGRRAPASVGFGRRRRLRGLVRAFGHRLSPAERTMGDCIVPVRFGHHYGLIFGKSYCCRCLHKNWTSIVFGLNLAHIATFASIVMHARQVHHQSGGEKSFTCTYAKKIYRFLQNLHKKT